MAVVNLLTPQRARIRATIKKDEYRNFNANKIAPICASFSTWLYAYLNTVTKIKQKLAVKKRTPPIVTKTFNFLGNSWLLLHEKDKADNVQQNIKLEMVIWVVSLALLIMSW